MGESLKHPMVYQINTRVWLRKLGNGKPNKLADIPSSYWAKLAKAGVDYVWLMGIWETTRTSISVYCFHPDLQRAYTHTNPAWEPEDVGGSPYAIDDYRVASSIGTIDQLRKLRSQLSKQGIGLILDFIPNHFNAHSRLIDKSPELFIQVDKNQFARDRHTYYERNARYFAHGKDPYFPAWTDTVQLNYFNSATHQFMIDRLQYLAELCDGVRCDMAMLLLPDVLRQTWGHLIQIEADNFWKRAIETIKHTHPQFIFIAEAYWGRQFELQQNGFDYAYDKATLDHLMANDITTLSQHLQAEVLYQEKLVRFIENHDEERSLTSLGEERSRAAATIVSTLPGMKLVYDGQWSGMRIRSPVQLTLPPADPPCLCPLIKSLSEEIFEGCTCQRVFYERLISAVNRDVIKRGHWKWINTSLPELLAWQMIWEEQTSLTLVNYSAKIVKATIPNIILKEGQIDITDHLNLLPTDWIIQNPQDPASIDVIMTPFKSAVLEIDYKSN